MYLCQVFQSTHPRRVRRLSIFPTSHGRCFNPRTHEGCDVCLSAHIADGNCFNPRTHEGCDRTTHSPCLPAPSVSIHAPTKGATSLFLQLPSNRGCFNPRTHEGCDPRPSQCWPCPPCFNPRTHEGCDVNQPEHTKIQPVFQSTHPRRVRHFTFWARYAKGIVSIHAPTKGATQFRAKI